MKTILASSSPRRKELLEMIGLEFEVKTSNVEEDLLPNLSIEAQSKRLAYIKAKAVFDETEGDRIIIGSDTIVFKENKIYGKPHNREEAENMLQELKNAKHKVITSISVLSQIKGKCMEQTDYDITEVKLKDLSKEEIENWLDTGEAYDKAGAYAIQGKFSVYVENLKGNFYSVMGLPVHKLYKMLKKLPQ